MKTVKQLRDKIASCPSCRINAHIHTHLCDGSANMTVENIASAAEIAGIVLVILTPHFHKQVCDDSASLYHDTNEEIFFRLRDEIQSYQKRGGNVDFLLSTEADILSVDGTLSLSLSAEAERTLDLVTPTVNYHPLLPLAAVEATDIHKVDDFYESGRYAKLTAGVSSTAPILQAFYEAQTNAVLQCPYPAMLGHFFAAHTIPGRGHTWFPLREEDLPMMERCADRLLTACAETDTAIDITGIHLMNGTAPAQQREKDGFLHLFQRFVLDRCRQYRIPFCPGSDAHQLQRIRESLIYGELFPEYFEQ